MSTTERRIDPYKTDIIGSLLYKPCYNILSPHTKTHRFGNNKDIRQIPLHIKTTLNNIKGCGPLNSIYFNGFSFLSGNISSACINSNGPFNNTHLSIMLFADRFAMVALQYKSLTWYSKAMIEGYIPQLFNSNNDTRRGDKLIRQECDNIKGRIEGEWTNSVKDKCIKFDINDDMFNIATAINYNIPKYTNIPIIMVSGFEININNDDDQCDNRSKGGIDGVFGIGARFAPCTHFQLSLRSDWALSKLSLKRILLAVCSEDNNAGSSLALMITAAPAAAAAAAASSSPYNGGYYEILFGGTKDVTKITSLDKYGINVGYKYRVDLLNKEICLSLYGKYNITNDGKYILKSKTSINYEHDRFINRRSGSNNIPIGLAFKLGLHVK